VTVSSRLRRWLGHLLAASVGLLVAFALAEGLLRSPRFPLPADLGGQLFGCYAPASPRAIYERQPELDILLPKPRFDQGCFFGGYHWLHHGDAYGFRNPEDWDTAEIVLMGDSMTYGHGVQENQTIRHFLGQELGVRVANLAVTAASPVQYQAILPNFALPLRPTVIVLVFFTNDLQDIADYRSQDQIATYLRSDRAAELGVFPRQELLSSRPPRPRPPSLLEASAVLGTLRFYGGKLEEWRRRDKKRREPLPQQVAAQLPAGRLRPPGPPPQDLLEGCIVQPALKRRLSQAYLWKSTRRLAAVARAARTKLVLAYLPQLWDPEIERAWDRMLADVARANDLAFVNFTRTLASADLQPLPGTRLPRDGHLSEEGNRRVAQALAAFLRSSGSLNRSPANP
jgi:hypothetical protein